MNPDGADSSVLADMPTNAMILPVPCKFRKDIKVSKKLNKTEHWSFTERLRDAYAIPFLQEVYGMGYMHNPTKGAGEALALIVKEVGCYQYSIAEGVNEIQRMDPKIFVPNLEVIKTLKECYKNRDFCFLILRLKPGEKYKPIIYMHPLQESGKMFIPTLHIHPNGTDSLFKPMEDHWDHEVYSLEYPILPLEKSPNQYNQFVTRQTAIRMPYTLKLTNDISGFKDVKIEHLHKWATLGQGTNRDMETASIFGNSRDTEEKKELLIQRSLPKDEVSTVAKDEEFSLLHSQEEAVFSGSSPKIDLPSVNIPTAPTFTAETHGDNS